MIYTAGEMVLEILKSLAETIRSPALGGRGRFEKVFEISKELFHQNHNNNIS